MTTSDIPGKTSSVIKIRNYKVKQIDVTDTLADITVFDPRTRENVLIREILKEGTVGVSEIGKIEKIIEQGEIKKVVMIGKLFSKSAKTKARARGIEIVSEKMIPSFHLFLHQLVPKHEILEKEEARELLQKYGGSHNFPVIRYSDPAVRLLGGKLGDVIKITRKSSTAGQSIYYRIVVEG